MFLRKKLVCIVSMTTIVLLIVGTVLLCLFLNNTDASEPEKTQEDTVLTDDSEYSEHIEQTKNNTEICEINTNASEYEFQTEASEPEKIQKDTVFMFDSEYNHRIQQAKSNIEICEINNEYSKKYQEVIDEYYSKLLGIANKNLTKAIIEERTAWNTYTQIYFDMQFRYLEQLHWGASIVPLKMSKMEYEYYREKAMEMSNKYEQMNNTEPKPD